MSNKFRERVSPYDLVGVWRQEQRILRRKRLERLGPPPRRNPYEPPRPKRSTTSENR